MSQLKHHLSSSSQKTMLSDSSLTQTRPFHRFQRANNDNNSKSNSKSKSKSQSQSSSLSKFYVKYNYQESLSKQKKQKLIQKQQLSQPSCNPLRKIRQKYSNPNQLKSTNKKIPNVYQRNHRQNHHITQKKSFKSFKNAQNQNLYCSNNSSNQKIKLKNSKQITNVAFHKITCNPQISIQQLLQQYQVMKTQLKNLASVLHEQNQLIQQFQNKNQALEIIIKNYKEKQQINNQKNINSHYISKKNNDQQNLDEITLLKFKVSQLQIQNRNLKGVINSNNFQSSKQSAFQTSNTSFSSVEPYFQVMQRQLYQARQQIKKLNFINSVAQRKKFFQIEHQLKQKGSQYNQLRKKYINLLQDHKNVKKLYSQSIRNANILKVKQLKLRFQKEESLEGSLSLSEKSVQVEEIINKKQIQNQDEASNLEEVRSQNEQNLLNDFIDYDQGQNKNLIIFEDKVIEEDKSFKRIKMKTIF